MSQCIVFARVSTIGQDYVQQQEEIVNEAIRLGYDAEHQIMIANKESAISLSVEEREGLQSLMEAIEKNDDVDCLICWELSRIARRADVIYQIRDMLVKNHIRWVIMKPYMELIDKDGKQSQTASLMLGIFTSFAESEMMIKKERMSRGKKMAQLSGKSVSNWLPLGYTTDSERRIIIDEEKAALVKKIFHMCVVEDKSTTVIARELTESGEYPLKKNIRTHASCIRNILNDSAYIGKGKTNKKNPENNNQYQRIISDELFYEAQELLAKRKKLPKTEHKNIYYCKGLLRDANSGYILHATSAVASYCHVSDRADKIKYPPLTVPINLFDCFAWHLTKEFLKRTDTTKMKDAKKEVLKKQKELENKMNNINKKREDLYSRIERIQTRIIAGKLTETLGDKMLEEIYKESEALKYKAVEYSREYHLLTYKVHKYESGEIARESLLATTDKDKYNLIHEVIKEIVVRKGGVPEQGRIRKRGLGVKYGTMLVKYDDGTEEEYKYNSYTKKCFTMDDVEVPYEFELRIKGQQHRPGYEIKTKAYRDKYFPNRKRRV